MTGEHRTRLEDSFHPPLETLPLIAEDKRFLGNFVRTTSAWGLNSFHACEHYFSDTGGLLPLMNARIGYERQVEIDTPEHDSELQLLARTLVGEKNGPGLTTRDLASAMQHIEALHGLSSHFEQFDSLEAFQDFTIDDEVDFLKSIPTRFGPWVRSQSIWVIGRYHESGESPSHPELRDPYFAARVIGFQFDEERSVVLPIVVNAHGTVRGFLPPEMRLGGDETGSWLYEYDYQLRPREPLSRNDPLDGVDHMLDMARRFPRP